jgi:hypothetical protein
MRVSAVMAVHRRHSTLTAVTSGRDQPDPNAEPPSVVRVWNVRQMKHKHKRGRGWRARTEQSVRRLADHDGEHQAREQDELEHCAQCHRPARVRVCVCVCVSRPCPHCVIRRYSTSRR